MAGLMACPALATPLIALGPIQYLFLALALGCGAIVTAAIVQTLTAPVSRSTLRRLHTYAERSEREEDVSSSPMDRVVQQARTESVASQHRRRRRRSDLFPTVSKWIANSPLQMLERLSADLTRINSNWRPSEILYAGAALSVLSFLVLGVLLDRIPAGIILGLIAFFVPFYSVSFQAKRWMVKFETQLADTLLLMANATAAGYGFQQAMEMVAREGLPPMSEEFARMNQEIRLGVPIADSMNHMTERVQSRDLTLTITAIQIAMEVGGALSHLLRTISETIRERVRIRGEITVLSTQGKLTGAILSALPIFLFFILNAVTASSAPGEPKYMEPLFNGKDYPLGPKMLWGGIVSQILGYMIIQKIVNIEI